MTIQMVERPGYSVERMAELVSDAVERMALNLDGVRVLTEAATGAYSVTPVIAALAGADVTALTKASRYGSVEDVTAEVFALADALGVGSRVTIVTERRPEQFASADLITNSGHLRPITGEFADAIRPGAALALMFESWEIQAGREDLALEHLKAKGVRLAGTNERHSHVDVFSYLGAMAVAHLADAGIPAYRTKLAVICDNPFLDYLVDGLQRAGAAVITAPDLSDLDESGLDAVIVSKTPTGQSVVSPAALTELARMNRTAVIVQFWGDIDREAVTASGLRAWPLQAPIAGHMGVLPSRLGPDAIVNLQAGGLKVGQVLLTEVDNRTAADLEYVDELS